MLILSALLVTIKLHHYGNNHEILFQLCSIYIFCSFFFLLPRAVSIKMLFSNLFINQPIPLFSLLLLLRTDSESSVVNVLFRLFGINGLIIYGITYTKTSNVPVLCIHFLSVHLSVLAIPTFLRACSAALLLFLGNHIFCVINMLNVYF